MNANFTYTQINVFGSTLQVPVQAAKDYLAKHAAVKEVQKIQAEGKDLTFDPRIDKLMGKIIRINRKIQREGWFSYPV